MNCARGPRRYVVIESAISFICSRCIGVRRHTSSLSGDSAFETCTGEHLSSFSFGESARGRGRQARARLPRGPHRSRREGVCAWAQEAGAARSRHASVTPRPRHVGRQAGGGQAVRSGAAGCRGARCGARGRDCVACLRVALGAAERALPALLAGMKAACME